MCGSPLAIDNLDEISVEELHVALGNVKGKKPTQRLLAAIACKNGAHKPNLPTRTALAAERLTVSSSDSTLTNRLRRVVLMLIDLGGKEKSQ